ncbi:hypothetical protein PV04_10938 [Phialophora macrospora]|uniref:Protein kinase domain-containing protein n=1 Tax=Phialophora macrospora TaxID=1851006 RepID=A0A0D2DK60_9EURO|nr:hypothetical protein PV04_10938 [Phialophora macrospora]
MVWMENGNLRDYLATHKVSISMRLLWLRQLAHALDFIHSRWVIVADISARNVLVAKDMSVKFSDFTEASLLPLDSDMEMVDDNGYSMQTDIGQFGALMYEVSTGIWCNFDLFKDQPPGPATAAFPQRDGLPSTESVWLGPVIDKCWIKNAFRTSRELSQCLDLFQELKPDNYADSTFHEAKPSLAI